VSRDSWPELDYEQWSDTIETLHMWTQIVGKVRFILTPWTNHSWHAPLYVTPVGMTTSTIYHGTRAFDVEFDLVAHELVIRDDRNSHRTLSLEPRTVASFYEEFMGTLDDMGLPVDIRAFPNEVEDPIPFPEDTVHASYDPDAATRFSRVLNQSVRVFTEFRTRFLGKTSPIHFFWGSFDLAVTRFSGRTAPPHPGGIPGLPDWVTREAYSHEVYSCGFWPGSAASPAAAFYAYAYPVPDGLGRARVAPEAAFWSDEMGEFFLPYEAVRTAEDPDAALTAFLESTYDAVADLAAWDRDALEVPEGYPEGS
jgi:hypothetical protein